MTAAIVDTGFVFALLDRDDQYHPKALSILRDDQWVLYMPSAILVEVFHLRLHRHRRKTTQRQVIQDFAKALRIITRELGFRFPEMTLSDYDRVSQLLDKYADSKIDYVDAVVIATAERFGTRHILTVDEVDFRRYVNYAGEHFILPLFGV